MSRFLPVAVMFSCGDLVRVQSWKTERRACGDPLMHCRHGSKWKTKPDSVLRSHRTEAAVVHWTGDLSGDGGGSVRAGELSAKPVTRSMISV